MKVLTHVGEVVDKYDLSDEVVGRPVDDGVHSSEKDGPGLVVEADDDRGLREALEGSPALLAPGVPWVRQTPVHRDEV